MNAPIIALKKSKYPLSWLLLATAFSAAGCAEAPDDQVSELAPPASETGEIEKVSQDLTGSTSFDSTCPDNIKPLINKAAKYGRIASNSPAFRACIKRLTPGSPGFVYPYIAKCSSKDPAATESATNQVAKLLPLTASGNALTMSCDFKPTACGGDANACAGVGNPTIASERFEWAGWISDKANASNPADPWWPASQAAGIMWHEAMHQYGYEHPATCSDPNYYYQNNTVPYIVGNCITGVLSQSGQFCGSADRCGPDSLPIITTLTVGTTVCQCVKDPRTIPHDIALAGGTNWVNIPTAIAQPDGSWNVVTGSHGGGGSSLLMLGIFAQQAVAATARVSGDFNGDGRTDIALLGASGWTTLPVAFAAATGKYTVTNKTVFGDFMKWASWSGVQKLVGDFNGDGRQDIALSGGAGWTTIPVAFSDGTGGFNVTNVTATNDFAGKATISGNRIFVGDFNGDGKSDLALAGGNNGNALPTALSKGDGSFDIRTGSAGSFPTLATTGATILQGDFNGDGKTDFALVGNGGWTSIPVATSTGTGTFTFTNNPQPNFDAWAKVSKKLAADFNGDGRTDIVLLGADGWSTMPMAISMSNGNFTVSNNASPDFALWAANPAAKPVLGDFNRDGNMDITLVGPASWGAMPIAYSLGNSHFTISNPAVGSGFQSSAGTAGVTVLTGNFRE